METMGSRGFTLLVHPTEMVPHDRQGFTARSATRKKKHLLVSLDGVDPRLELGECCMYRMTGFFVAYVMRLQLAILAMFGFAQCFDEVKFALRNFTRFLLSQ